MRSIESADSCFIDHLLQRFHSDILQFVCNYGHVEFETWVNERGDPTKVCDAAGEGSKSEVLL